MRLPVVAIVGRPNVGKSTLFNRILGARHAIVDDRPGVTRDRHAAEAEWAGRRFTIVDTGGLVPESQEALARSVNAQIHAAILPPSPLVGEPTCPSAMRTVVFTPWARMTRPSRAARRSPGRRRRGGLST